jgi:two-component system response regulator BaeR/two-component system response regulator AdeR
MPDRGTILAVDDDQLTCELVQVVLAAEGFHVFIATTGPEALALFRQHAAKTRAVLLDLWMPGMSGKAVCEEIYRTHPGTRIILMTAVNEPLAQVAMAGVPVAGFLSKPFHHAELLAKIREVVEGIGNPRRERRG